MSALHLTDRDTDGHSSDLESAFNDGYENSANSVSAALLRWLVILWAMTTIAVGSFVIARSVLEYAPQVLSGLGQIFS